MIIQKTKRSRLEHLLDNGWEPFAAWQRLEEEGTYMTWAYVCFIVRQRKGTPK